MIVKFKKVRPGSLLPTKGSEHAACYDCYLPQTYSALDAGERRIVPLGFQLEVPVGYKAVIYPRSGLASKGITCHIGTIDADYRGEVGAILTNNSRAVQSLFAGDRICQMAIEHVVDFSFEEAAELNETERGESGFGSSGGHESVAQV